MMWIYVSYFIFPTDKPSPTANPPEDNPQHQIIGHHVCHRRSQRRQHEATRSPVEGPPEGQTEQRQRPGELGVRGEVEAAVGVVDADEECQTARDGGPVTRGRGGGVEPPVQTGV